MIYGFIIAAGNQKRFKSDIPKALYKIAGISLLDRNIENLNQYCDKVFVVVSKLNYNYFKNYNCIIIDSGHGCGDAVFHCLEQLSFNEEDTCFIVWGDSLSSKYTIKHCIENYSGQVVIPCVYEEDPYVSISQVGDTVSVLFSKYGEKTKNGYHDLSIFYGNCKVLFENLQKHYNIVTSSGDYIHKHGNEMQFLDIFNDLKVPAKIITEYVKSLSFNTLEEYYSLEKYFESKSN